MWLVRKSVLLLMLGVCVLISSCDGPSTTVAGESRSPNGAMIATAYTLEPSGIGTGDIGTNVYLRRASEPDSATIILAFWDLPDEPDHRNVGMKWLTSEHLELTYKGPRRISFQAIRCYDIDITLEDISEGVDRAHVH